MIKKNIYWVCSFTENIKAKCKGMNPTVNTTWLLLYWPGKTFTLIFAASQFKIEHICIFLCYAILPLKRLGQCHPDRSHMFLLLPNASYHHGELEQIEYIYRLKNSILVLVQDLLTHLLLSIVSSAFFALRFTMLSFNMLLSDISFKSL